MDEPKYKRVLLKISGEALAGDKHFGLDFQVMGRVADVINRYTNGQPDGETHISRRSTGGIGGAFKSSCSVLDRTTNTLSSDIVKWLQSQAASATAAEITPVPATH